MIKTIFFDFDGVICESVSIKTDAFYEMYLPYGADIAKLIKLHHLANGGMSRFDKFVHYHKHFLNTHLSSEDVNKLANCFSEIVLEKVIKAPLVDGIKTFLQKQSSEFRCHIVSATPDEEIKRIIKLKGLQPFFKSVHGSPTSKTKWVKMIITEAGLKLSECVFIGDANADYEAAKGNNIQFILRSTEDNKLLFRDIDVISIPTFYKFYNVLRAL